LLISAGTPGGYDFSQIFSISQIPLYARYASSIDYRPASAGMRCVR
jgi:hypothetical protein